MRHLIKNFLPFLQLSVLNTAGWEDTVIWNPYGNEGMGYNKFVCVESVKVRHDFFFSMSHVIDWPTSTRSFSLNFSSTQSRLMVALPGRARWLSSLSHSKQSLDTSNILN